MTFQHPIVVGVDGSAMCLRAVRWAAREAAERRWPLRLVAVVPDPGRALGDTVSTAHFADVVTQTARRHLMVAEDTACYLDDAIAVESEVSAGHPIRVLLAESERARLLVVGPRGQGGVVGLLVGSVAAGVAARAACPVVVVRGRAGQPDAHPDGPIVVGIDGSNLSETALAFAFDEACRRGARLVAVHTWLDRAVDVGQLDRELGWDMDAVIDHEQAVLAERLAGWSEKFPDVPVNRLVLRARPARVLVDQSASAQLVVVGSHGRGRLSGAVLGSVSQALLHRSECPVAVVRPEEGLA